MSACATTFRVRKLAWGGGYFDERYSPNLRLDAIENEYTDGAFVTAFVEHKNVAGFTVKLSYRNLCGDEGRVRPHRLRRPARRAGRVQRKPVGASSGDISS